MSGEAFAVWLTGPEPASVEAVAGELAGRLVALQVPIEVLDARTPGIDALGAAGVAFVAAVLARHGVASVVALPAGRTVRERARAQTGRLIEVYVHAPGAPTPGGYEPPERAEVEIVVPEPSPGAGVERVLRTLELLGLLAAGTESGYSEAEEREVIRRLKAFGYL